MRTFYGILAVLLALTRIGLAQDSGLLAAISKLPPCAISCLTTAIEESPCQLTDQACVCSNAQLNVNVESCVVQSCTLRQALITKNTTSTLCHAPIRTKTRSLKLTNIILGVISAAFVLTRVVYKGAFSVGELGWDDWMILASLVIGVPSTVITDLGTIGSGLGRDVWTLPYDTITDFVRWFYVMEILYFFNVAMVKLSLLFFFLRIFPARPVKRLIWSTIVFDVLFGVAFVVAAIFQCRPLSYYWWRWDGEHKDGKCVDINALGWANAAISIALDAWMLVLPLWQVSQLKLAWKKKLSVALMFFVGTFVTVVSILRLQSLIHFANSTNPTWDQADISNWSTIEINVAIMCACMPALRIILVRLCPRVFASTNYTSTTAAQKYGLKYGGSHGLGYANSRGGGAGRSGHHQASAVGSSRLGGDEGAGDGITYTKTFEVRHAEDEEGLFALDELDKGGKAPGSSASSGASVSAASSPVGYHAPGRM